MHIESVKIICTLILTFRPWRRKQIQKQTVLVLSSLSDLLLASAQHSPLSSPSVHTYSDAQGASLPRLFNNTHIKSTQGTTFNIWTRSFWTHRFKTEAGKWYVNISILWVRIWMLPEQMWVCTDWKCHHCCLMTRPFVTQWTGRCTEVSSLLPHNLPELRSIQMWNRKVTGKHKNNSIDLLFFFHFSLVWWQSTKLLLLIVNFE